MNIREFRQRRESAWRTLENRLGRRRKNFQAGEELVSFIDLYRSVASDLSYARTFFPNDAVTQYLNSLVTTAHNRLYRKSTRNFTSIGKFLTAGFPAKVRSLSGYIGVATILTVIAALFGYVSVLLHPANAYALLPASFVDQFDPSRAGPHAVNAPLMSSVIMTNNIHVTLIAFVGGLTLSLFTLYILWHNGLILGVIAAIFQESGKAVSFWALIVPHGVTELSAIFIAGGSGLLIGHRMIAPGRYRRGTEFRLAVVEAVQLLLGTTPMLIIAGTIEGFLTPSSLPMWSKFAFALITAAWWTVYFGWFGRGKPRQTTVLTG